MALVPRNPELNTEYSTEHYGDVDPLGQTKAREWRRRGSGHMPDAVGIGALAGL